MKKKGGKQMPGNQCHLPARAPWDLECSLRSGAPAGTWSAQDLDDPGSRFFVRCLETLSPLPPSLRSSPPDPGLGGLSSPEAKVTSVCLSCLKTGIFYQTQPLVPFNVGADDSRGVRVKGDDPGG